MAFDLVENPPERRAVQFSSSFHNREQVLPRHRACETSTKWRQSVLGIVYDCLGQLDLHRPEDHDHIWLREARQRASNFAELGLCPISRPSMSVSRHNRKLWDISAVAVLGGAYRLLAKCDGSEPVQCQNLLNTLLTNMTLAYAPVCGQFILNLNLCSLIMTPVGCRALILSVGLLVQAAMKQSRGAEIAGVLEATLMRTPDEGYEFAMRLKGCHFEFFQSQEMDLVSRLCGLFKSELSYSTTEIDCVDVLLIFPGTQTTNCS